VPHDEVLAQKDQANTVFLLHGCGYHVRNGNSDKGYWTRIGAAWAHADGNGFNIQIETLPLDGRITLRIASEKSE